MQSDFFIKRRTSYEEIQNKKLKEFYVVVQMVSTELYLGEGTILEPSKVIMLYGLDILGFRTILGMYIENKEDNRYWISELEKIKRRGLKKILYVSIEENNKRLEQALRIVYNPYINESINERVEKVAKYTQKKWVNI
jgi:transposase, mutator family